LRILLVLTLLLCSCLPRPHEVTGKRCDQAHPCGGDSICIGTLCKPESSGTSPNLVPNPDFEDGVSSWLNPDVDQILEATSSPVHSGILAAKASHTPTTSQVPIVVSLPRSAMKALVVGRTYCTEVWVQRGNTTGSISVALRKWFSTSTWEESDPFDLASHSEMNVEGWQRLRATLVFDGAPIFLNLRVYTTQRDGAYFFLDDTRVWLDEGEGC
jgi:hypothetical protein